MGGKMSPSCPISTRRIDSNMVRIISIQIFLLTAFFIFTNEPIFAYILLADSTVRVFRRHELSPFALFAKAVIKVANIMPKFSDESPKRFALYLSLFVSLSIVVLFHAGLHMIATYVAFILLICAFLEALFDFCVGCKIYYGIQLIKGSIKYDRYFN